MLGAIIGDIVGSPYEFGYRKVTAETFPLFTLRSRFTDDTVMTLAVAEGLMNGYKNPHKSYDEVEKAMQKYGRMYPRAGYGKRFSYWLTEENPQPYNSYGNGAAMRVSSAAWIYNSLTDAELFGEISAKVTHNHPEGLKGAAATAGAIYLARSGSSKKEIRRYLENEFDYDLSKNCDHFRKDTHRDISCQETIPPAFAAFAEGNSFEEVIRLGVSLGGDTDTIAAIAGSIAEGFYGIPEKLRQEGLKRLTQKLLRVYEIFEGFLRIQSV